MDIEKSLYGIDLNLLTAFEALLEEGSVTRAAHRLAITQSAMSNTLARLRRQLGDDILIRVKGKWELTMRAKELHGPLSEALGIVREQILGAPKFDAASSDRRFNVAIASVSSASFIAPHTASLRKEAPGVSIKMIRPNPPFRTVLESLQADLLILPSEYEVGYPSEPLLSMQWKGLVNNSHPLASNEAFEEDFSRFPTVLYEHEGAYITPQMNLSAQMSKGQAPLVVDDLLLIPFFLANGNFIGVLPEAFADLVCSYFPLRTLDLPAAVTGFELRSYWHPRSEKDEGVRWLRKTFKSWVEGSL